jgi:hypothetical protein
MKITATGYTVVITDEEGKDRIALGTGEPRFFTQRFSDAQRFRKKLKLVLTRSKLRVQKAACTIEVLPRAKRKSKVTA